MYEIFVKHHFCAAHKLLDYDGECSNLHGHDWKIIVTARTNYLNDIGISLDFKEFKRKIKAEIDKFDHKFLNEHEDFKGINPTAENIAKVIFNKLSKLMNDEHLKIYTIEVWESETQGCRYFKDE